MKQRPDSREYAPYYDTYIRLVPEGGLSDILKEQLQTTLALLQPLTEEQAGYRYESDKWSIKEVIGHISDNERIMAYRLLRIARGDTGTLAGYDQEPFVRESFFDRRSLTDLLEDLTAVRQATLTLLRGLTEEAWSRQGVANNSVLSVRALACIIAGHELHHRSVLQERYGLG
ncbi:DinB family protein [Paenibacillus doosanensis]|uniref:DinB superfamily protein n=1 Tax=Paenibacillus konkukensis TaxID=2020716 RepID=A0ABY4RNQ2_9BACL|nr:MULTISPECIES: DinB family protein [Paenibacillus]MCS7459018.1 DinB family protein [Paenibacillus doosanensis]UQZ84072.1 DinB superfamily protein [Paenibacillus konkukensis]